MGGNLIGGWAHARDLIYVDKLIKMYHSDEKVMLTLQLAEKCGINAIISNPAQFGLSINTRQETGGKIKFISDCGAGKDFRKVLRSPWKAEHMQCTAMVENPIPAYTTMTYRFLMNLSEGLN